MPPIINFKICDNSRDCNGIGGCPAGVFTWCETDKTIKVEASKCIDCGACAYMCTVNAIRYAKCADELKDIQAEIDADPRTIADLFVDRYGADTVVDTYTFEYTPEKLQNRIESNRPAILEINRPETIQCLLGSIPISHIQDQFHPEATYSKFITEEIGGGCFPWRKHRACFFIIAESCWGALMGIMIWIANSSCLNLYRKFNKSFGESDLTC